MSTATRRFRDVPCHSFLVFLLNFLDQGGQVSNILYIRKKERERKSNENFVNKESVARRDEIYLFRWGPLFLGKFLVKNRALRSHTKAVGAIVLLTFGETRDSLEKKG